MRASCILVTVVSILLWVDRLPAPIVEEEKPKPAAEQSEAPKRKHSARSTSAAQSPAQTETKTKPAPAPAPALQGPARFVGTWTGKVNQGLLGHVQTSVTVNSNATSVELNHNLGGGTRPATINGNTISWHSGVMGDVTWTLIPNSDGQTAQVTMKGKLLNDSETF